MPSRSGKTTQHKVLVYLFGSLGDTIVAIPALRAVRRHFSEAEIVLLQNVQKGNIVSASEVIPSDLIDRYLDYTSETSGSGKLQSFYRLWKTTRGEQFDAVVYLVISERPSLSVHRDKLFFRSCGISESYGFHPFSTDELYPSDANGHPSFTEHEAVRKLNRLELDGISPIPEIDLRQPLMTFQKEDLEQTGIWLASQRVKPGSRLIAIAPGCKTHANDWPLDRFIEVGRRLISEENCEILIVGGKAEFDLGEEMVAAWKCGINAAGKFTVPQSGTLLSMCDFYVGLDTGTTHLAAAVGTPCFALYGERNNPGHWFPLGDSHTVVFHRVECAGCRLPECLVTDHPCMNGISVDSVWKSLTAFASKINKGQTSEIEVIPV
ncbi:MAG: glycosyltransferase family 9 protein [Pyrinomonadaceae bacterium]|nr:glycosyltransferase family 9 protein [Pyrinomonadaceae bacterium]MBP6212766.1 glycosyltransferase family 9 protein [Pyrinomonadaceae bacterium]